MAATCTFESKFNFVKLEMTLRFVFILLLKYGTGHQIVTKQFRAVQGKIFAFEIFSELLLHRSSLLHCVAKCLQEGDACQSVDFFPLPNDFVQCNLQTRLTTNTAFLLDSPGSAYACKIRENVLLNFEYL